MKRRIGTVALCAAYLRWLWRRLVRPGAQRQELRAAGQRILQQARFAAVDVGAALGLPDHWRWLEGEAYFHLIEPRSDACRVLREHFARGPAADRYVVHEAAVSDRSGSSTLYVANVPTGTSLLRCDWTQRIDAVAYSSPDYLLPIREVEITTRTLSELLDGAGEGAVHLIKLDVQGAEIESLRGLQRRLDGLLCVEVEIGMHGIYPPGHDFADINTFLRSHGMELYDVRVARTYLPHARDGSHYQREVLGVLPDSPTMAARLWEFDAIFFRRRADLLARGDAGEIRRMLVAYLTYNFYAEAFALCAMAADAAIVSAADAAALKEAIKEVHDLKTLRPWYLDSPINARLLRVLQRISPRNGLRWSQHTYQAYPNG